MTFNGICFNAEWVLSMTLVQFLAIMQEDCYQHIFEGDPKRDAKLKEVYRLIKKVVNK